MANENFGNIQSNLELYKNDSDLSTVIREAVEQILQNEKNMDQIKKQTKDITTALKEKGIDMKTFSIILSQQRKPLEQRNLEIETMEEVNDAVEKIFKMKKH